MSKKSPPRTVEELRDSIAEEIRVRTDVLSQGTPRDYAEYQKIVGAISGLALADQMLKDLLERMNDDDDLGTHR